ncbi:MAG: hypothetical protein U9O54_06350, partial [Chloroflexota bacterium]|nr:hypothetical protein [Chloroflexota bacterium]
MVQKNENDGKGALLSLKESMQTELSQANRELENISRKLQQSQREVDKLSRRNVSVTARLRKVRASFDDVSRNDIRETYDAALDAQQRLFVMRGQMEKLQSEQVHLQIYVEQVEMLLGKLEEIPIDEWGGRNAGAIELIESV